MLEQIQLELMPEEEILWSGKSSLKKWISYGDYMYIPFSLMWCGFVLYWEWTVIRFQYPASFHLLGIPFAIFGLYMVAGRFLYKYYKKKSSCYVLTNLRAIEAYEHKWFKRREMPVKEMGRMLRFVEKDGYGVIVFNDVNPALIMKLNDGMELFRRKTKSVVGFYDIENVEQLYEMVQALKRQK